MPKVMAHLGLLYSSQIVTAGVELCWPDTRVPPWQTIDKIPRSHTGGQAPCRRGGLVMGGTTP